MSEINDLHVNMIADTQAHFAQQVVTVDDYPENLNSKVNTPAIFFEVETGGQGLDLGDDRVAIKLNLVAHLVLSNDLPNVKREIVAFASEMFRFVCENFWNLNGKITAPEHIEIGPSDFKPGKHGFESWYCSWEQTIYLGVSEWAPTDFTPTQVYLGVNINEAGFDVDEQVV